MKKDLRGTEPGLSANFMLQLYLLYSCLYHFEKLDDAVKIVVYF